MNILLHQTSEVELSIYLDYLEMIKIMLEKRQKCTKELDQEIQEVTCKIEELRHG